MTLVAIARINGDGQPGPVRNVGVTQGSSMLTAGPVAVFALDVSQVFQLGIHRRPIAIGEHGWESPTQLRSHVIKAAINGIGIYIITNGMAGETGLAVVPQKSVDSFSEDLGVSRVLPRLHFVRGNKAAAMAQGTGINANVGARSQVEGDVGGAGSCGGDGYRHLILTGQVGTQLHPACHLGH